MADDGVKISALTEVLSEPATGEMVASVVGGVTYKRNIGSRLPSTTQKSALAGYGGTPSGTNPYATQASVKPLSDLSRVMRINGDGVPIFPDNVAGRLYWHDKDWTVTTGWTGGSGVTLSVENSSLKVVSTAGSTATAFISSATYQNKLVRIVVRSATELTNITTVIGSTVLTAMRFTKISADKYIADIYWSRTGSDNLSLIPNSPATTAITWYLESICIGSGLYDTPVYDKACCNRATNNGVLPVPAPRGLGLSFNGAQYLQFDNPVIGTTGTIYGKFATANITQTARLLDNSNNSGFTGVRVVQSAASLIFAISSASASQAITLIPTIVAGTIYTYKIAMTASNVIWSINDGSETTTALTLTPVISSTSLRIGANSNTTPGAFFSGIIHDIGCDNRTWSLSDGIRYHNGDDAVDSQQKANTGVPHAIAVNDAYGFLGSNGLRFPATQVPSADANTLDDYEESTFTPSISIGGSTTGITYSVQSGTCTKIGRSASATGALVLTNKGGLTGAVLIDGLPFVNGNAQQYITPATLFITASTYTGMLEGFVQLASTSIHLYYVAETGTATQLNGTNLSNSSIIRFSVTYNT